MLQPSRQLRDLEGLYRGARCFLVLNGPSAANAYPLLEQRGIVTMAVNNGWTQFRPTLWCCHDNAQRFSLHGWADPSILKFVPSTRLRDAVLNDDGTPSGAAGWYPGVVPFDVRYDFRADKYLDGTSVMAGAEQRHVCPDGHSKTVSVMMCALKVLLVLGFETIFLVGADMGESNGKRYAFREEVAPNHQDHHLSVVRHWLGRLAPILRDNKIRVVNTTLESRLTCFEFCPLQLALESVRWMSRPAKTEGRYRMGILARKPTPRFQ